MLERPLIWIQALLQEEVSNLKSLDFASHAVTKVTNNQEALALIKNATDHLLNGGATYLLWNRADEQPPARWISMLIGIQEVRSTPFQQIGESRHGLQEIRPIRLVKNDPFSQLMLLGFLGELQTGSFFSKPLAVRSPSKMAELQCPKRRPEPLIRPSLCEGVLILAANQKQVQEHGLETLRRRATQRALEGGFTRGIVLELEGCSDFTVSKQLKRLLPVNSKASLIVAFIGVDDLTVPGSWDLLSDIWLLEMTSYCVAMRNCNGLKSLSGSVSDSLPLNQQYFVPLVGGIYLA